MPICPNGHQSGTDDYCEICGIRMPAGSSAYGPPPSSASSTSASPASAPPIGFDGEPTAVAEVCPQCATPREGMALFCEECRYNFRTHSPTVAPVAPLAPMVPPPSAGPVSAAGPGFPPFPRYESQRSRPSQVNRAAEPLPSESVTVTSASGDFLLDPPSAQVKPDPQASAAPAVPAAPPGATSAAGAASVPTVVPSASGLGTAWVAEIGADREYFTAMMARSGPDAHGLYFPAFSPGVHLPLVGHQITIGRRRHSSGEAPDIDLGRSPEDPGVSHKHAVLVQQPDGTWAVVDQDSTNGTTVNLGEEPIQPFTPVPLNEGDRVHVGAWTTITIRRA